MKYIPSALSRQVGRQLLQVQKNSPALLFATGIVGFAATTVLACRSTLKIEEVLQTAEDDLRKIELAADTIVDDKYSDIDKKRDQALVYVRTGVALGKLYWPALLCGAVSVAALTKSHGILTKRNAALTAAYAAIEKGFDEYRQRVIKDVGEEKDREYRYGPLEACEIEDEDRPGKTKKAKVVSPQAASVYARFFDELSPSWNNNPDYNRAFLKCQQNYANDLLQSRGHIFLNEVYDMLGIPRSSAGQVVGWVISKEGDNFVDFGIFNGDNPEVRRFVNGQESAILLDFNVDGVVHDKI